MSFHEAVLLKAYPVDPHTPLHHTPTQDNGKPIWSTRNADVPLAYDHIRYYAG